MTDFKKVKVRLRAALKEYKIDEHDQLSTELSFYASGLNATWEEACNSLIRSVCILQGREKSGYYDLNHEATCDQLNQCGTCKSIDQGKAQDPCYGCRDFDKWEKVNSE